MKMQNFSMYIISNNIITAILKLFTIINDGIIVPNMLFIIFCPTFRVKMDFSSEIYIYIKLDS